MEDEDFDDLMEVETDDEVIPSAFTGKLNEKFIKTWERPPVAPFNPQTSSIIFQNLEIDYTMSEVVEGFSATTVGPVPVLRLFGVNESGNSILLSVHGYMPYFYIVAPNNFKESDCDGLRQKLNNHMKIHRSSFQYADFVLEVCIIRNHRSIMGYRPNPIPFLKITLAAPMLVPTARKIFERGEIMHPTSTFESNIQFALRFMIDKDIVGASWVECPAGKYKVVDESNKQSQCQIELLIKSDDIISLGVDDEWSKIAPLRILSFDIECTSRKGIFPEPETDAVIQIGNYVNVQGQDSPLVKTIFTYRGCAPIVGSQVISFNDEKDMLENWSRFVRHVDPDIITGYNIANFDFHYLTQRARAIKANQFLFLSRITREKSRIKEAEFSSKAYGRRVTKTLTISGRVQLDMLLVMQRDYKLRSYSLNAVSAHFLGQQKEDVHYSNISVLFNGTDNDRRRLAVYCLKDSYLPLLLMDKLMVTVNYLEMARVTGVPVNYLLSHGQQVKVQSQLYRKARQINLIIPTVTVKVDGGDEVAYEGATVIPPKSGFYDKPISTLDFASLYPSIMMAHNLCYSTLISAEDAKLMPPSHYVRTPSGDYFIKRDVQLGVLPCILEELIAARKKARKALEEEKDPFKAAVQNGRQFALKISANSVYGFTGALRGKLPCIAISASVTSFGREMIDQTKKSVEEKYCIANGYKHDAVVIYGDTDSVMVKFGVETVKEAMELGREASKFVSATFIKPINLEFEKVYYPYLLMKKKRYAGLLWTKEEKHDKMDAKGIVTVRRDNCALVREVIDTCLHKILIDRDPPSAELFVKKTISDLLQNRVDLSLLVITKALSKNEYQVKQAHVELAERMRKRDAGSAPTLGDRIPYVIVKRGGKSVPAYEKAEDPLFVLDNNIELDLQYYLEHQLKKPLIAIFSPILKNPLSLISGEHTMTVSSSTPKSSSFFKTGFVKRQVRCMNCNAVIPNDDTILCSYCKNLGIEVQMYQKAMKNVTDLEVKFSRIWTQCQTCQGSFHQPVLCTSRDCPIFYMRKKVQKDLNQAQENLERFQIPEW